MTKSVDVFKTQYYNHHRIMLLAIGQWPYQNKMVAIPLRIIVCSFIIIFANGQVCKIIKSRSDAQILIEAVPFVLNSISTMIRFINGWVNIEKMKELMSKVKYDRQCAVLNNEDHIFESYAKETYKLSVKYTLLFYTTISAFLTLQAVSEVLNRLPSSNITRVIHQPLQGEFFVNEDKYFVYILTLNNVFIITGITVHLAVDLELNMIINHVCAMFAIIGNRLKNAFRVNLGERDESEKINEILVRIVDYHEETLKIVDGLNSYCSWPYILVYCVVAVVFSIVLLHICIAIKASETLYIIAIPVLTFFGEVIMLFYNTSMGQKIMDASSDVFHQSYCGEWYTASVSAQKSLLLIMRKCMDPTRIVIANVFSITLKFFASIMETSLSYFMVFYSLQ